MKNTYAVIMAGGVGSRFWPSSRAKTPKQLLDLTGSGKAMIAATVERLSPLIPIERVIVVTGEITVDEVARTLPALPKENILAEPIGRNTAPCIGWAAVHVANRCPDGVMAVMPSDHLVADVAGFQQALKKAIEAAKDEKLVTFGIQPDAPETGFGYIDLKTEIDNGVFGVNRFVEKPNLETAKTYLEAGNFVWNSGMFFFRASRILGEIGRQMPALKQGLDEIDQAIKRGDENETLQRVFPTLPSESIDYGIMEGAKEIYCVPSAFGWSDLGSWEAAHDLSEKDQNQNAFKDASVVDVNAKGCLVRAPKDKVVALAGVENLIVVDTGDALLICSREKSQDVKHIVDALKIQNRKDLL